MSQNSAAEAKVIKKQGLIMVVFAKKNSRSPAFKELYLGHRKIKKRIQGVIKSGIFECFKN